MTPELTAETLNELERLELAATKEPWQTNIAGIEGDNYIAGTGPWYRLNRGEDKATEDAKLIAALRNAAKPLIAAARERDELRWLLMRAREAPSRCVCLCLTDHCEFCTLAEDIDAALDLIK